MLSVRLDKELEEELNKLAKLTKRSKSFFIKEALREYLEDVKDVLEAQNRVNDSKRELLTLEFLKRELDV